MENQSTESPVVENLTHPTDNNNDIKSVITNSQEAQDELEQSIANIPVVTETPNNVEIINVATGTSEQTLSNTDATGSMLDQQTIKTEVVPTTVNEMEQKPFTNSTCSPSSNPARHVTPELDTNSNMTSASDDIMEISFTGQDGGEQTSSFDGSGLMDPLEQLSGKKRKTKRRGTAWTDDETDFLMEVWARNAASKEEITHNTPVYRLISTAMLEKGYDKSWEQCKTRIHTLKRAYKITTDEIKALKMNVVYCKHFDKLRIIMGDDPITSAQMLADSLSLKRLERETMARNGQIVQTPPASSSNTPKRKLGSSNKSSKRQHTVNDKSQMSPLLYNSLQVDQPTDQPFTPVISHTWIPAVNSLPTTVIALTENQQQQQQHDVIIPQDGFQMPPPPPYQPPPSFSAPLPAVSRPVGRPQLQEINNNITIKAERGIGDDPIKLKYSTPMVNLSTVQSNTVLTNTVPTKSSLQQKKEELEKMKLDLEIRKLDMERNKLEMEERQRREERDHEYRMMQLLLFGLGQQNAANMGGHVTDHDLGHVSTTATLSRAIENGLLPGGSLRANEKGLSFSEI